MKRNQNPVGWSVAAVLLLALSACSSSPEVANTTPATGEEDKARALVYGEVESDIYEELKADVTMVPYDGTQDPEDYAVVIFDGHDLTPKEIREEELIENALRGGTWVLSVDVTEDHKRGGLGYHLDASTQGGSPYLLSRVGRDANGRINARFVEAPQQQAGGAEPVVTIEGATVEPATRAARTELDATYFAEKIAGYLNEPLLSVQSGPDVPDAPAGLLYKTFQFSYTYPWTSPPGYRSPQNTRTQDGEFDITYTAYVFLDNRDNPQGNFQYVLVEAQGSGNPTRGTGNFVGSTKDEYGWYQLVLGHGVTPDPRLKLQEGSQPGTENGSTSVTSSIGFDVGFDKDGPSGTFNYSHSETRDIRDWRALNNSSVANNQAAFQFISSHPFDGLDFVEGRTNSLDVSSGTGYPYAPNDLSRNNMQFFTQSLFKTDSVVDEEVNIGVYQAQSLGDVFCSSELGALCMEVGQAPWTAVDATAGFNINLGAVIPVGLKSLTFAPNPVKAGQTATGTLTLASPAETDITLEIESDSRFATPTETYYTIPKGATSLDFTVETSPDGTSNPFGAKFSVAYGAGINATLTVTP